MDDIDTMKPPYELYRSAMASCHVQPPDIAAHRDTAFIFWRESTRFLDSETMASWRKRQPVYLSQPWAHWRRRQLPGHWSCFPTTVTWNSPLQHRDSAATSAFKSNHGRTWCEHTEYPPIPQNDSFGLDVIFLLWLRSGANILSSLDLHSTPWNSSSRVRLLLHVRYLML